ncbi:tRNA (uracil) methyltransferase [Saccharomycopsis crataegensis]|uniref:tRNA (uracil-O(2)-)-methyltransferase n=1 Tax=Saccharomycopsis crataegensis TaxID=43959 RepID=A0AAV5QJI7_9ASCO|nr:tRNA (uracil) methyltransferase [Saccharomycopsis crataegensis]
MGKRGNKKSRGEQFESILQESKLIGNDWIEVCSRNVEFKSYHFEKALYNLILQPEINSTVLLRADILRNTKYEYLDENGNIMETPLVTEKTTERDDHSRLSSKPSNRKRKLNEEDKIIEGNEETEEEERKEEEGNDVIQELNLDDMQLRDIPTVLDFKPKRQIVRRLIPRNPYKDYVINQTCLIYTLQDYEDQDESLFVVYIPHIESGEQCPYYLPPVEAVGIFYHRPTKNLSLNYLPFGYKDPQVIRNLKSLDSNDRTLRIAFRLLQTAQKHSKGVMDGYEKRVQHDVVVSKVLFQNRYIALKKQYSQYLIDNWQENTDPKKHVFEDIAIAAFLIELWQNIYGDTNFQFADLGCGNGILVYILIMEGFHGIGIDARARKSWKIYPDNVSQCLKEQVIIPRILLEQDQDYSISLQNSTFKTDLHGTHNQKNLNKLGSSSNEIEVVSYNSKTLMNSSYVNTGTFPDNTFVIGNHSDELTLWIPLFGYDFMVIPCCSHALSGNKTRFLPKANNNAADSKSTYSGLVQHTEEIASQVGWKTEREMLRIPSTRNCAIVGHHKQPGDQFKSVAQVLELEGGADGWVENTMSLMKRPPRGH